MKTLSKFNIIILLSILVVLPICNSSGNITTTSIPEYPILPSTPVTSIPEYPILPSILIPESLTGVVKISLSSGSDTANVPTQVSLTLTFTEAVNGVESTTVQVTSTGSSTNVITTSPSISGNSYTFSLSGLTNATTYNVTLNGITSVATGLPIVSYPFSFITVALGIPTVQILYPINGATGVALNPLIPITLTFSEAVTGVSNTTLAWTSSNGSDIPFTYTSIASKTYTLTLTAGTFLNPNTIYNVRVRNGITGVINTSEVPPTTFSFTTVASGQ